LLNHPQRAFKSISTWQKLVLAPRPAFAGVRTYFRLDLRDRLSGQPLWLYWASYAESCIPSGGAPDDGWINNALGPASQFNPQVTVLGTYTYTLSCSAGPNTVTESVTVTVENNAPYTTASVNPTTVTFSDTPSDYLSISWKSNLNSCTINSTPNGLIGESSTYPLLPSGASDVEDTAIYSPSAPGTYLITVTCNPQWGAIQGAVSAAPITVTVLPPPPPSVTISSTPPTVALAQNFTLTWSSTNADNCTTTGDGGPIGVIWNTALATSGSQVEGAMFSGQATLGITCQSIDPNQGSASAQTTVTVGAALAAPTAMLSVSPITVTNGQSYTLTWSSSNASNCSASGGGANGSPWTSSIGTSGSSSQTASVEGSFTYTLVCTSGGGTSVQSQAILTVVAASSTSPSGGKSGGGGGAFDTYELILLTLLLTWQWCRTGNQNVAGVNGRRRLL
jgi:hypothetical protein